MIPSSLNTNWARPTSCELKSASALIDTHAAVAVGANIYGSNVEYSVPGARSSAQRAPGRKEIA
jgi:hypothetical protein